MKKSKNKWWHWFERGAVPVIYCNLRDSPHAYRKEFFDFAKTYLRHIFIWHQNKTWLYWRQQDLDNFAEFLKQQILDNTDFLEQLEKYHYAHAEALIDYCKDFHNMDFSKKTDKQLLQYFEKFEKLYNELALYTYIPVIGTFPLEGILEPYLKKKLKKSMSYGVCFSLLTHHGHKSWSRKEEEDLFEISKCQDADKLLDEHTEKFAWLNLGYKFLGKPLTKEYFKEKLEKIKTLEPLPKDIDIKTEKLVKELDIDEDHQLLFKALGKIIWLKEYRDGIYTWSHHEFNFLIKEILKRFNIPKEAGFYMKICEYKDVLKGKDFDTDCIKKRKATFVWLWDDTEYYYEGESANKKLAEELDGWNLEAEDRDVIQGSVASPGKVRGVAKIVENESQLSKVEKGDILITYMTKPSFLPAMERAAAIVTNEGGVTCHAAIVSREMKKPCVIGIKVATQVFKDGDMVEVDADKGVVKKIK